MDLNHLNTNYKHLSPRERLEVLYQSYSPEDILLTSSFGSTSVILLHLISQVQPKQSIYFIDTGYHFEETRAYKEQLKHRLGLQLIDLKSEDYLHQFTNKFLTYRHNQDLCCYINKVEPVNLIRNKHKVWISGLLRFQNANRQSLKLFEQHQNLVKFHPLLDMTEEEVRLYCTLNDLPIHPLVREGYDSIGCSKCTVAGVGRSGRWLNSPKTECGLHATLS